MNEDFNHGYRELQLQVSGDIDILNNYNVQTLG